MIEQLRRGFGRAGYRICVAFLAAGAALFLIGYPMSSADVLAAALCFLVALPIVNVLAVLAEEIGRRDWSFVGLAAAVFALLAYSILQRVGQS